MSAVVDAQESTSLTRKIEIRAWESLQDAKAEKKVMGADLGKNRILKYENTEKTSAFG